ncbi:MAG TPA: hypothetical protein VFW25_08900 [Silvibacterium sp.]|nr:hypothetical protein [Silvibacterium sp.]
MLTRRNLLQFAPVALSAKTFSELAWLLHDVRSGGADSMELPERYPAYPADLIKTIVTVAHFDKNKLKELIDPHPHLVKSAWDWGFGDWETPLGAACHMGRRDIAEYLLSNGATPSLFSWVLFGDIGMVQQIIEHRPGIERMGGPHSISLLAHARMGGQPSQAVFEFLRSLKDADSAKPIPLSSEERMSICGAYRFGAGISQLVEVTDDVGVYLNSGMYTYPPQLNWMRQGTMARPLFHMGSKVFYPAGAPRIQIRFETQAGAEVMTVRDGEIMLTASHQVKA